MSNWLAIGPPENWKIGTKVKVWAVSPRQYKSWEQVAGGDVVFFYATAPVKGLIGYGLVEEIEASEEPFWPDEKKKGHVLWPYRLRFREVRVLGVDKWESKRVEPDRKAIVLQRAFQPVTVDRAEEWRRSVDRLTRA